MSIKQTITENIIKYSPEELDYNMPENCALLAKGFICKLRLNALPEKREEKELLNIEGFLKLSMQLLNKDEDKEIIRNAGDMYYVYVDKNGNSPILKVTLFVNNESYHPERTILTMGIPLNLYDASKKDVYLLYDGVRLAFIVDGRIVNCEFPFGETKAGDITYDKTSFSFIGFNTNPQLLKSENEKEVTHRSMAFYSSAGYNDWAGDIINFWHGDTYHMVVLYDRHHHRNRFGGGAHSPVHITTKDFINWENHGELYSFKRPWETFGTGTLFFHNGKYYYAFGLHTSRMIPSENTAGQIIEKHYRETGETKYLTHNEIFVRGLYPNGTNYLVSDDGINFKPGCKQVHWPENPSIYTNSDDTITMYAGYGGTGTYIAPHIDGPWRETDSPFPSKEMRAVMGASTECPSMFDWNGYRYLIMGFVGFYMTENGGNTFKDMSAIGQDIYDGLCVPMVADCNGRYILSGWLSGYGWGYVLQHRELVQKENGIIGMKWLPELTPNTDELNLHCSIEDLNNPTEIALKRKKSYYLECSVLPDKDGKVGIAFSGEGAPFVFSLDSKKEKVQTNYSNGMAQFPDEIESLCEYATKLSEPLESFRKLEKNTYHHKSHNFSIIKVDELKTKYKLCMMIHYEAKSDSIIIDAQIAEGRTFISNRPFFNADSITVFAENAMIQNFKIFEM